MANELFIKHKLVDEIPSSPEVGSIYYERKTGIEKVVESDASIVEVGNIEKMLSAKIGEGQNSNIFNDLDNVASGDNSHAEGSNTTASGQCAHTEGSSTTASGAFAHAEGYNTVAAGDYSHAEGYGTVTNNTSEHAEGSWNISTDNTVFSIGNGTDAENRSNLYEVHSDGSIFVKNVGDYNGTNAENATDLATILNDTVDKVNTINTTIFQTKTDETLTTTNKTIVEAINEVDDMVPAVTIVPELTANYTIQANSSIKCHVYIVPVGATKYEILYSGDITWRNGKVPTTQANHTYVVTVFSNLGFWDEF